MNIPTTTVNMIILPALRAAMEVYMTSAATTAAAGQPRIAKQFLHQHDQAKALLEALEQGDYDDDTPEDIVDVINANLLRRG